MTRNFVSLGYTQEATKAARSTTYKIDVLIFSSGNPFLSTLCLEWYTSSQIIKYLTRYCNSTSLAGGWVDRPTTHPCPSILNAIIARWI